MSDLQSRSWIVFKGISFLLISVLSAALLFQVAPTLRNAILIVILAWSSARFYYFLFYVLERYVDPSLKYSGILALLRELRNRSREKQHL